MASNIVPFPTPTAKLPQQPGLNAFIVYDAVPQGCELFEVKGNTVAPHVRQGEFAVIDTSDTQPMHGELFVIQWSGGPEIVEIRKFPMKGVTQAGGKPFDEQLWAAYYRNTMISIGGEALDAVRWFDGPYRAGHLAAKLRGRVVGLYQPPQAWPRLAA